MLFPSGSVHPSRSFFPNVVLLLLGCNPRLSSIQTLVTSSILTRTILFRAVSDKNNNKMSLTYSDNLAPQPSTDVFTSDTNIDRRKCHRTVPMKVLALGVGRTGTACMSIPGVCLH